MKQPHTIPEDRVPAILARAAELDRQTMTMEALRAAALEAGIGAAAVDQALQEYVAGKAMPAPMASVQQPEPLPRWRRWLNKLRFPLKLAALGALLGVMGSWDEVFATLAILALIGMGGWLAWRDRATGQSARFQLATLSLGVSMFLGMVWVGGDEDALAFIAFFAVVLLLLGTVLVHYRGREAPHGNEVSV